MTQLDELTIQLNHQQTVINIIQATLVYHQTIIDAQQNDIVNIQTSINNIIHSLSHFTAKLSFQITLPPPLPLSPPTPLSYVAAGPTTPTPSLPQSPTPPHTSAAPPFFLQPLSNPIVLKDVNATRRSTAIFCNHIHKFQPTSISVHINSTFTKPFPTRLLASILPHLPPLHDQKFQQESEIKSYFLYFDEILCYNDGYSQSLGQQLNIFSRKIGKSKRFIFDPDGEFESECSFVARSISGDAQLNHNSSDTTSKPLPPIHDHNHHH